MKGCADRPEAGKPIAQVVRELGVNEGTLGNWVAKDTAAQEGTQGLSTGDIAELRRRRSTSRWPGGVVPVDNAAAEAFSPPSNTTSCPSLHQFTTRERARRVVLARCHVIHKVTRRRSSAGTLSPINYETAAQPEAA